MLHVLRKRRSRRGLLLFLAAVVVVEDEDEDDAEDEETAALRFEGVRKSNDSSSSPGKRRFAMGGARFKGFSVALGF